MKSKVFIFFASVVIISIAVFNINLNLKNNGDLPVSGLSKIEAVARHELPEVVIECSNGGSGTCYYMTVEEGLYGVCRYDCEFDGDTSSSCSSCFVNLANFCSAMSCS